MRCIFAAILFLGIVALLTSAQSSNRLRLMIVVDLGGDARGAETTAPSTTPVPTTASTTAVPATTTATPSTGNSTSRRFRTTASDFSPNQDDWTTIFPSVLNKFVVRQQLASTEIVVDTINSKSSAVIAVSEMIAKFQSSGSVSTYPDAIIIAESARVTDLLLTMLPSILPESVPILTVMPSSSANDFDASASATPNVFYLGADNIATADAMTSILPLIEWRGLGIISAASEYADAQIKALESALSSRTRDAARILARERFSADSNPAQDDAAVKRIVSKGVKGILVIGDGTTAARLLASAARLAGDSTYTDSATLNGLTFLFAPQSALRFPVVGQRQHDVVVLPQFASVSRWPRQTLPERVDDQFTFLLSYVIDAMDFVILANSNKAVKQTLLDSLRQTTLTGGYTGNVAVDATTQRRKALDYLLLAPEQRLGFDSQVFVAYDGTTKASTTKQSFSRYIYPSPLNAVTVCMIASDSCTDVTNVNHALMAFLDANAKVHQNPEVNLPAGIQVTVKAIAAGYSGVQGLRGLLASASSCDFIIGPARTRIMVALAPVINYYEIPVIDFGSTSPELSNKMRYPTFSRTVPTDAYTSQAFAAIAKRFGWDRAAVLTTDDTYGMHISDFYSQAFTQQAITLEQTVQISDRDPTNATLIKALTQIRDTFITRIIVVALPTSETSMRMFFDLVNKLGMARTHIFLLSDTLCQYAAYNKGTRTPLIGSFCVDPDYSEQIYKTVYASLLRADKAEATAILAAGGFATTCDLTYSDPFSPFAHDAALVAISAIKRAVARNGGSTTDKNGVSVFANGTATVELIRDTRIAGTTGIVTFTEYGDRKETAYRINVQQDDDVVVKIGTWNDNIGFSPADLVRPLVWGDNTTKVPKASNRDAKFIAITTVKQNPTIVALSVLGFVVTIALAVFCYKHHKLQQLLEEREAGQETEMEGGPKASRNDGPSSSTIPAKSASVDQRPV